MIWEVTNKLLDALDSSINSNAFFIQLGKPDNESDIGKIIVQHLRTGNFHFELVKQDINRGWNLFTEMVFSKDYKNNFILPNPGNSWNGNENITCKQIDRELIIELITDMLTGGRKYFSVGSHTELLTESKAKDLINSFLKSLDNEYNNWESYRIEPDFLNQVDDYYTSGNIKLGYFENCKRDLALGFKMEDSFYILLTNGYG